MNSSENINPNSRPLGKVPSLKARRPSRITTQVPKKIDAPPKRIADVMQVGDVVMIEAVQPAAETPGKPAAQVLVSF